MKSKLKKYVEGMKLWTLCVVKSFDKRDAEKQGFLVGSWVRLL